MPPKRSMTAGPGAMKKAAGPGPKRSKTAMAAKMKEAARKTKSGSGFKKHDRKGGDGAAMDTAASAVKKMKSMKTDNGRKKLVLGTAPTRPLNIHTDTERSLPTFMQGRVKDTGPVEAKLGQVGGGKTGKGRGRALPAKKIKDKKGAKYATGKGGTMDGTAVEAKRRGSDDFSAALDRMDKDDEVWRRSKRNPLTKFIQGRVRAYKRYMLLRKQAKTPVVLGDRAKAVTDALEMTQKHLKMMRAAFHEVDFSRMGNVSYEEFFEWLEEPRSLFTDALYDQMIAKATGQMMQLDDFIITTILYCNYGQEDLLRLIFNMFDKDGSGTIDEEEFVELCQLVNNGSPVFPGNFKKALEEFDTNDDGLIDFDEFKSLNQRYAIVLFPAFRLQQALQRHTLGESEWVKIAGKVYQKRLAENYARKHGGMPPPSFKTNLVYSDKLGPRIFRQTCCCLIPHLGVPLRPGWDQKKKPGGGNAAGGAGGGGA